MTRQWSDATKRWVITAGAVLILLSLYALRSILTPFIVAAILAYILTPLVNALSWATRLPRTLIVILVYIALVVGIVLTPVLLVPNLIQQVRNINLDVQGLANSVRHLQSTYQTIEIMGYPVDLTPIYDQITASLTNLVPSPETVAADLLRSLPTFFGVASGFASGFASTLIGLILVLVVSFYIVRDMHRISLYIDGLIPDEYREEISLLRQDITSIWNSFFRGQLILCLVIGVATGTALWVVGVRSALTLGVVAGVLEIIPNLGPVLSAVPAVVLALLQGSTHLPLSNGWFALLVVGLYVVIQQVENNYLVPRIIGSSVRLHPLVVLLGVVAGASLAGILGIFLAAPVLATVRVIARYAYSKLLDQPYKPLTYRLPEPEPQPQPQADAASRATQPATPVVVRAEPSQEPERG